MKSWGGLPDTDQRVLQVNWPGEVLEGMSQTSLAVGMGRSYGDVGLAASGVLLGTTGLNRFIAFDAERGILRCEAGVTIGEILRWSIPRGWILAAMPGTQYVTVGGAIANDVHGKNHHRSGTFGCHVLRLALQRSDGQLLQCSPEESADWFAATVGGLGLTGVVLWAELQLQRVVGPWMEVESIKFASLEEFFHLSALADVTHEYAVAWIDCLASGAQQGRGHFIQAQHSESTEVPPARSRRWSVPFSLPFSPINRWTLRGFNSAYYHRQRQPRKQQRQAYSDYFFPLDSIEHANRMYGRRGFRQYQCVVPAEAVSTLLDTISRHGEGSFLAVLKMFGDIRSPALMSFPRPGATLALDFPWRGEQTLKLFTELDAIVREAEGALYPAKDAHMSGADFRRAYPAWEQFLAFKDPQFNSLFWQRVMEDT